MPEIPELKVPAALPWFEPEIDPDTLYKYATQAAEVIDTIPADNPFREALLKVIREIDARLNPTLSLPGKLRMVTTEQMKNPNWGFDDEDDENDDGDL